MLPGRGRRITVPPHLLRRPWGVETATQVSGPATTITCPDCGRRLLPEPEACPACGSDRRQVSVTPLGVGAFGLTGSLGLVMDEPGTAERPHAIVVQSPLGARSEARLSADGRVTLQATGPVDIGTRGEPQVHDVLIARLRAEGFLVEVMRGADDKRGEDGLLVIAGARRTVQVTAVPGSPTYWREAAQGSASTSVDAARAIEWMRGAIESKAHIDDRASTILALDARHAGILADPGLADRYRDMYTSPVTEFGFAQVWVVGPTASHCTRL